MTPFLVSFLITALVTPGVIALAWRMGWVARPRDDRWHSRPTALMGGIGIFLGAAAAVLACGELKTVAAVALPATFTFLLGVVDDRVEFKPHHKLIGQVAATAMLIAGGVTFHGLPPALAVPLTFVWVVGITNAINLLDNMDGLAAGVAGLAALALTACIAGPGAEGTATAALALAGACAGFLVYNFNPARIFMGDCGSLFIGFALAALAIQGAGAAAGSERGASSLVVSLLVPVAVLAIPIFDTTLVATARALNGRPILPGFRDHSSHRMVALGLSERETVLLLYGLTILFGGLALAATHLSVLAVIVLAVTLFIALAGIGVYLGFLKVYPEPEQGAARPRLLRTRLSDKKQLLQVLADLGLIPVAFLGAYLLRFEGELPAVLAPGVLAALPAVIAVKLASLAACRAYRGVWRYAGVADALAAVAGSTLGSLASAAILGAILDPNALSRSALLIDWLLFTVLAVTARTGYVVLREVFAMLIPRVGPRIVILGSGVEAVALILELRDPLSPRCGHVVGILDDDTDKHRRALNGVPVLGALAHLTALLDEHRIDHCLLGTSSHSEDGERILEFCRRRGVTAHRDLDTIPATAGIRRLRAAA